MLNNDLIEECRRIMKVSIFDVAKKSGLSVVTVSRVLNNATTVREKNRQKVLQAMKELDYHPNAAARSLAKGKTGVIGLILTTLQDSFLDDVVQHVSSQLKDYGYYLTLTVVNYPAEEGHGMDLIQEERVDGLLILSAVNDEQYVAELQKRNIPSVLIDNQMEQSQVPSVQVDNFKGGYEATRHLVDLGHKRIAHIQGPSYFLSAVNRERGFMKALNEAGLMPFAVEPGEFSISSGYAAARRWIEAGELPDAVFASDDYMAIGAINALIEAGYKVPEDVSVIGYDDQLISSQLRPRLSTVRQPSEQLARTAVDILMKQVNGDGSYKPEPVVFTFQPQILLRESTIPRHTSLSP